MHFTAKESGNRVYVMLCSEHTLQVTHPNLELLFASGHPQLISYLGLDYRNLGKIIGRNSGGNREVESGRGRKRGQGGRKGTERGRSGRKRG